MHLTIGSARRLARGIHAQTGEGIDPLLGDPDDTNDAIVIVQPRLTRDAGQSVAVAAGS